MWRARESRRPCVAKTCQDLFYVGREFSARVTVLRFTSALANPVRTGPSHLRTGALAERQLGVQIFERDSRSVRLSVVGTAIIEQVRRVLLAAHELRELARQSADPFHGTLRLGVIPTIGPFSSPRSHPRSHERSAPAAAVDRGPLR